MVTFISTVAFLLSLLFPQGAVRIPDPGGSHSGSGHTFTDVNGTNFSCSSSPCAITYTSTSGYLLVITFGNLAVGNFITALTGGGTWTIPSGCLVTASVSMSCAYIISNKGATSFSLSYGTGTGTGTLFEWSYTGTGSVVVDGTPATASDATSTTQTMISPSITGTSDLVVQGIQINTGSSIRSFSGGYTVDEQGGTRGQVHLTNTANMTAPVAHLSGTSKAEICELAFK